MKTLKQKYEENKVDLLNLPLKTGNKELFAEFLAQEEYKLKRTNGLSDLSERQYKTLLGYISKLKNVDKWFKKSLRSISAQDIKEVYDGLEDEKILTTNGKPFKDRQSYYNKIFKSKLFQMVGKADFAREVIEFAKPNNNEVRFFRIDVVKRIVNQLREPRDKFLAWLMFDVGENVNTCLKLRKKEFMKKIDEQTRHSEYHVRLDKENIKSSRTARTEPLYHQETIDCADEVLPRLKDTDLVFPSTYSAVKKRFQIVMRKLNAVTEPHEKPITFKDFRSSMACHWLNNGLTREQVDSRLGHTPFSRELDKYINYFALDKKQAQQKVKTIQNEQLHNEVEGLKQAGRIKDENIKYIGDELAKLKKEHEDVLQKLEKISPLLNEVARKGGFAVLNKE